MEEIIQMPRLKLGSQGLEVSRMGFGCAGFSGIYNAPLSHEEGCSMIKAAFDSGITFFDTSDLYGPYDNEIMVGKVIFSYEASLTRLDVDYIDLYYQHRVDPSVPIENTMGELKKLVEEGKVKYIGLSEANVDTIRRAHSIHPITAIQMEYSLWTREIEHEIIPLCRQLGIGIVAYSPLGRGFFGGKTVVEKVAPESQLNLIPRFTGECLEKNKVLYTRLEELADKHYCSPSQLALAWILHQGDDIVPIPGTTKLRNLKSNIRSVTLKLTEKELETISEAVPSDQVFGEREGDNFSEYSWKFATTTPLTL